MGLDKKLKKANFMIDNTKSIKHLERQVKQIVDKLNQ
jgi:dephospho-CoA kinase